MAFPNLTRVSPSILAISLLLIGCSRAISAITPSSVVETATPALSPTEVSTQLPTTISISTNTSVVPTPTLAPTLAAQQRKDRILELLRNNAGCLLPCWWGIIPGQTTWTEAKHFLSYIGAKTGSIPISDGVIFHGTGGFDLPESGNFNKIDFYEQEEIVKSIRIHAEGYTNPGNFRVIWSLFAPEKIIATYGQPNAVWVSSISDSGEGLTETAPYDFWLGYNDLGFLIRYRGSVQFEPTYRMCPTFGEGGNLGLALDMSLHSPNDEDNLVADLVEKPSLVTLETATGLTVESLTALFLQDIQPICFETPREIWP